MALQHLRSSTANKRPTPAGMSDGQLALNTNDASPGLFFKDSNGALVKVGPVHVGTTAPNATPGSGGSSGNAIGEQWLDTTGGTYVFKVWDGSAWRSESGTFVDVNGDVMTGALGIIAGTAGSPGLYFSGDTNTGLYSPGADQVAISTGGSGKLFIGPTGDIGVGISSWSDYADRSVHLYSNTNPTFKLTNSTTGTDLTDGIEVILSGSDGYLWNRESASWILGTNNTERLRITAAGLVGVGTSSPGTALDINGVITSRSDSFAAIRFRSSTGTDKAFLSYEDGSTSVFLNNYGSGPIVFKTVDAERVRIDSSGRVGIGTSTFGNADADDLTVAGSGNTGITVRAGTTSASNIYFADGTTGDDAVRGYFAYNHSADRLTIGTNAATAVTIDSSQRVGIGTTSPAGFQSGVLHVHGSTGSELHLTSGGSGTAASDGLTIEYRDSDTTGGVFVRENGALRFGTNDQERARIDSSGRLLVGTSSAPSALGPSIQSARAGGAYFVAANTSTVSSSGDILGEVHFLGNQSGGYVHGATISATADATWSSSSDGPTRLVFSTTADGASSPTERMRIQSNGTVFITQSNSGTYGEYISFSNGAYGLGINNTSGGVADLIYFLSPNYVGGITTNGSTTSYLTASDYRLKENIALVADSITRLRQLKPIRFNFIADPGKTVDGFIAHEVQAVVPEAITGEKDAVDDEGNPIYQGIDQSKLVPLLTAALQEAIGRIETLEAEVAALKAS